VAPPRRAYNRKRRVEHDDEEEEFHTIDEPQPARETGRPKRKRRLEQSIPDIIGRSIRHKWMIDGESVPCIGTILGISAPGTVPEEAEDGNMVPGTCYDLQYDDEDFVRHLILEGDWQRGDIQVMGHRVPPEDQ